MEGLKLYGGAIKLSPQENGYKKPISNGYCFECTGVMWIKLSLMNSIKWKLSGLKILNRSVKGCN